MEARERRRAVIIIIAFVLLLRLPFLNQAIQGDDPYYLFGAQHALIDPAHPSHAKYVFQGELVDMRGHPHPPLNSWILAALLAIFGDVYEVPFHAAYIVFSLIAALSMFSIARRFTEHPLAATLVFLVTPAFVINGNSLESDVPFLAFWMAGFALFLSGRLVWASLALALAAMAAYQALVATPILIVYCWLHARRSLKAWVVTLVPVVVIGVYQLYERMTSGALPATVLAGYFSTYGLQQVANKVRNALALTAHTGWIAFPVLTAYAFRARWPVAAAAALAGVFIDPNPLFWASFAVGALAIASCIRKPDFLTAWVLIFFVSALVLFFAGSARYLLPMAAPLAILVTRGLRLASVPAPAWRGLQPAASTLVSKFGRHWIGDKMSRQERRDGSLKRLRHSEQLGEKCGLVPLAIGGNLALGIALAFTNYQHWDGYRKFARSIERELHEKRVWINGEFGLRFYLESEGALPLARAQTVQTGEWIVESALGYPQPVTAPLARVLEREIRPLLPLRLIGLDSKSGYSTASLGFRPFDITTAPVDRIRLDAVLERKPVLSYLPMNAPEAPSQIASGVYQLEDGRWRWMSGQALVLLKRPESPKPLRVKLVVHDQSPARLIRLLLDGNEVHVQTLTPGANTVTTKPVTGSAVTLIVDKTFSVPGDHRQLGVILSEIGFE